MVGLSAPLRPGERYMHLMLDADEVASVMSESEIRIFALNEAIRRAEASGVVITRGPDVVAYHRPEYPGDQTTVTTLAVGRLV